MKRTNYSYVGISFIILVFGIIFIPRIVNRIKNDDMVRDNIDASGEKITEKPKQKLAYLTINGQPKKVPEFSFINQNGDTISNRDYLGKVYIVEFFFTTCPTICPKMNANLVDIQNMFKTKTDFGMASFTINPDHDTREVLKAYAEKYAVTNTNWHFMTGNKDEIYALANQGFNLFAGENPEAEGGFEHSGNFALIDKNGYFRSRTDAYGNPVFFYNGITSQTEKTDSDGLQEQISWLIEDVELLLKE